MSYIILEKIFNSHIISLSNDILLFIYDYLKPNKINNKLKKELLAMATLYNYERIRNEYDNDCRQYNERMNEYILHDNNNYMYMSNPPCFEDKIFTYYGTKEELKKQLYNLSYFKTNKQVKNLYVKYYLQLTNSLAYAEDLFDDIEEKEYYNDNIEI